MRRGAPVAAGVARPSRGAGRPSLVATALRAARFLFGAGRSIPFAAGAAILRAARPSLVMARDDYAYLQTDADRYFSTVSLAQLEKRLDGHGFFRVHRGYLVNLSMVEEIESVSGGTLLLTLNGVEEKIPVSRRRVSALKKALGL